MVHHLTRFRCFLFSCVVVLSEAWGRTAGMRMPATCSACRPQRLRLLRSFFSGWFNFEKGWRRLDRLLSGCSVYKAIPTECVRVCVDTETLGKGGTRTSSPRLRCAHGTALGHLGTLHVHAPAHDSARLPPVETTVKFARDTLQGDACSVVNSRSFSAPFCGVALFSSHALPSVLFFCQPRFRWTWQPTGKRRGP